MAGRRGGIDSRVNIVCGYVSTLQATDHEHLARAIELAEGVAARTSPNPLVGAVIVRDGRVLGEGFHAALRRRRTPSATALAAAGGADLRGATLYVSLEPCCHTGRTPPCTDAIIEAGIARVVVGSDDPTEKASGRGLGILRDEGIEVERRRRRAGRARPAAQPAVPQARPHRAPVRALQVRDDARRQGRDPHRRLEVDLGRGLARGSRTAGAPRSTPSWSGSAPRWPTTRS